MNKREYLRSLGFKVGERGRFTPEMLTALRNSNQEFDSTPRATPLDIEMVVDTVVKLAPTHKQVRDPRTLYGLTREGSKVAFVLCFDCTLHMMYCNCKGGILAPSSVISTKEKDVRIKSNRLIMS